MTNAVNNKRVFLVTPHVPSGYLDILGRRDDVRLDMLDNGSMIRAGKIRARGRACLPDQFDPR
jgi:hypothetical protein